MKNIVLIEDDLVMKEQISSYLTNFNFSTNSFESPIKAISFIEENQETIDCIILDLMLPELDGFDVCKNIKQRFDIPIIISSARADIGNKIYAYEIGADDYLSKPYEPRELVLKIEAITKRYSKESNFYNISDFKINEDAHSIYFEDYEIEFTKLEYEIFIYLLKNKDKIISREQLKNATSLDYDTKNRVIDTHISNIRQKIDDDAKNPKYIKSIWGIGYKFIG